MRALMGRSFSWPPIFYYLSGLNLMLMFPIPNLPTDNFYKFCFVGGLVLILAGGYFSYSYNKLIAQVKEEHTAARNEIYNQHQQTKRLRELNSALDGYAGNAEAFIKSDFYKTEVLPLTSSSKLDSVDRIISQSSLKLDEAKALNAYSIVSVLVGLVLTSFGGVFWYYKVQKVQDDLLVVQLNIAQAELITAKISLTKLENEAKYQFTSTNNRIFDKVW